MPDTIPIGKTIASTEYGNLAITKSAAGLAEALPTGWIDSTNNKAVVEQRYSGSGALTSDTAVKSGAGFLHTITISMNDAAPTAGTIDVYDNTSASGTKLFTWTLTTAVFTPFTVTLDVSVANGIYVDFTTTADVAVFVSYR